jgi:hypothetical protein
LGKIDFPNPLLHDVEQIGGFFVGTIMIPRRFGISAALLLVAAPAFAQFSTEAKIEVLEQMDRVLAKEAFVPGVDMAQWRGFLARRQDQLDAAETPREFAAVVNSGLKEFGVSHINLSAARMRRRGWDGSPPFGMQQGSSSIRGRGTMLRWIDDHTALVRVSDFDRGYSREQAEAVFDEARDADGIVLDLRSNPGGEVENMRHFLGLVIPNRRPVGTFVTRRMAEGFVKAGKGNGKDPVKIAAWAQKSFSPMPTDVGAFRGRMSVLVDDRSASAAEVIANALREIRGVPIVGTPSAGAVLMSTFEALPHGFRIQFPVSDYVSINGKRLEKNPIRPDVAMSPDEVRTDAAIDAGVSALRN